LGIMSQDTDSEALEQILAGAAEAAGPAAAATPVERAAWLNAVADALDAAAGELIPVARRKRTADAERAHHVRVREHAVRPA
jgi:NADP-dependent aldehyde dehydrogenase